MHFPSTITSSLRLISDFLPFPSSTKASCRTKSCDRAPCGTSCTSILHRGVSHHPNFSLSYQSEARRTGKPSKEDDIVWVKHILASRRLSFLIVSMWWDVDQPLAEKGRGAVYLQPLSDVLSLAILEEALVERNAVHAGGAVARTIY